MIDSICLVTGATSGIGKATALGLAKLGATVVLMARDAARGEAAVREIKDATEHPRIDLLLCDLSSQASIRAAADQFRRRYERLSVLINNAAIVTRKRILTQDGLELTFATNHLAPFLLTHLLLDRLHTGAPARVINVTAPSTTKPDFDDLQGERKFGAIQAFGASKACNLLFTHELARRLEGRGVTVNAYHPGIVRTGLMRQAPIPMRIFSSLLKLFALTPDRAAEGLVQLASASQFEGVTGQLVHKGKVIPSPFGSDTAAQERLWAESVKLVGLDN